MPKPAETTAALFANPGRHTASDAARHIPVPMRQLRGAHLRYHYKSWSDAFECPTCGHRERRNLNFFGGGRLLICDGVKRERVERLDWQGAAS